MCGKRYDCDLDCNTLQDGEEPCAQCADDRYMALGNNTQEKVMNRIRAEKNTWERIKGFFAVRKPIGYGLQRLTKLGKRYRALRFFWQRWTRGWDDSECWSLDLTMAQFILPRLKRLREIHHGYPPTLTAKSWDAKIDLMIYAFERLVKDPFDVPDHEWLKVKKGLRAFAHWYSALWD